MVSVTLKSGGVEKQEILTHLIFSALQRERAILERGLAKTQTQLESLEKRYGMTTTDFFERYQNGEMDDRNDFIDWAGEYHIYMSIREQIDCLEGMSF